jgi:REP element-mobilizing transposase RayT
MPQYIRAFVPGGTFFFTVNLLERRRKLLTEHIDTLREVFKAARRRRPFTIEAIVILPDHLHCIWTLPSETRISPPAGMISRRDLPPKFPGGKDFRSGAGRRENEAFGSGVFGNTSSATSAIMSVTWITSTTIR